LLKGFQRPWQKRYGKKQDWCRCQSWSILDNKDFGVEPLELCSKFRSFPQNIAVDCLALLLHIQQISAFNPTWCHNPEDSSPNPFPFRSMTAKLDTFSSLKPNFETVKKQLGFHKFQMCCNFFIVTVLKCPFVPPPPSQEAWENSHHYGTVLCN
jgi:hypothetical protein